jgi:hypothetical protein
MIAAVSAVLLFIFMFLPWLGFDLPEGAPIDDSYNAWKATQSLDVYLFIVILAAVVPALLAMGGSTAQLPFLGAATTFLLAVLGIILIFVLIIDPGPFGGSIQVGEGALGFDVKIGLWLGLLATGGIAVGGYLAMQDEAYGGAAAAPPPPIDDRY